MTTEEQKTRIGGIAADQLRTVIERIEKLTEEREAIAADIRDVFAEAKGNGLDVKAIREVIKLRKLDAATRNEQEHMLDTYKLALGMATDVESEE